MVDVYSKFKQAVEKYEMIPEGKMVLAYFSGGKDSAALLDLLQRYKAEREFELRSLLIYYPKQAFRDREKIEKVLKYWQVRGIRIEEYSVDEKEEEIEKHSPPWDKCLTTKGDQLSKIIPLRFDVSNLVIMSGHSQEDVAFYLTDAVMRDGSASTRSGNGIDNRRFQMGWRLYPKLTFENGLTVAKPLMYLSGNEIQRYVKANDLPVIPCACPYLYECPKRLFFRYLESTGKHLNYEECYALAKKLQAIPGPVEWPSQAPGRMFF
jgi:tRNA(Ile)-lysidine synthase TilS/MesJ